MVNRHDPSSVSASGQPSARIVLLKEADQAGFVFYTNYESRKGRELAATPEPRSFLLDRTGAWSAH